MKIHKKEKKKMWRILLTAFVLMFIQSKSLVQADKNFNNVIVDMQLTNDNESGVDEHESDYSIKVENQKNGESGKWKTRNQRFFYYENGKSNRLKRNPEQILLFCSEWHSKNRLAVCER